MLFGINGKEGKGRVNSEEGKCDDSVGENLLFSLFLFLLFSSLFLVKPNKRRKLSPFPRFPHVPNRP